MQPETPKQRIPLQTLLIIALVFIVIAGLIGWRVGRTTNQKFATNGSNATGSNSTPTADSSSRNVKSLVTYTLPDGWKEGTCPNNADRVYLIPGGTSLNCDADPSAPIKLSIDQQDTKDCQQLANPQNVRKHVCISLFINGHKSLKSTTEYLSSSALGKEITLSDYYIDTGKGVVKLEYAHTSSNDFQNSFDQIANTIKVKN